VIANLATITAWAKDIRLDWPTVMFDDYLHQLNCQWQPSFIELVVQCWRALEAMGEV